jgi:hypothetical protein
VSWFDDPVVDDLKRLSKLRWTAPIERFAPLHDLLGLRVVEVWAGDARDLSYRVGALRGALTDAVKRLGLRDEDFRGVPAAHAAAAAEWLFGLNPEAAKMGAGARREEAAKRWKPSGPEGQDFSTETFRRHIQVPLTAYVAAELRAMSGEELPGSADLSPSARAITEALRTAYPRATKLSTLVNTIVSPAGYYGDVTVELTLTDADPEEYTATYQIGFDAELDEYVLAFASSTALANVIIARCPEVNDVWVFSDERNLRSHLNLSDSQSRVRVSGTNREGAPDTDPLNLTALDAADAEPYLPGLSAEERETVVVLRATVPDRFTGRTRFVTRQVARMQKKDHYCYWAAQGPMFVRQLICDYSGLSGIGVVNPVPLLGVAAVAPRTDSGSFTLDVENWLAPGQGFVVTWSGAS